eukprot:COSAG02_NODE_61081_length_269_cov_0.970588_1_plen_28_part_01
MQHKWMGRAALRWLRLKSLRNSHGVTKR